MLKWIKFAFIVVLVGLLVYVSWVKIDNIVLKDINVVNLRSLYLKDGFPVYTKTVSSQSSAIFLKDLAIVPIDGTRYFGYISKDLKSFLEVGSTVFVPNYHTGSTLDNSTVEPFVRGKVTSISNDVDWKNGFYRITVTLDKSLPSRTFYSAKVVYKILKNRIVIPITMMSSVNDVYYGWLDDNGKAKRVKLDTGVCDGYNCEILAGLNVGDKLITSDTKLLKEGTLLLIANDNDTDSDTSGGMMDFDFKGERK